MTVVLLPGDAESSNQKERKRESVNPPLGSISPSSSSPKEGVSKKQRRKKGLSPSLAAVRDRLRGMSEGVSKLQWTREGAAGGRGSWDTNMLSSSSFSFEYSQRHFYGYVGTNLFFDDISFVYCRVQYF